MPSATGTSRARSSQNTNTSAPAEKPNKSYNFGGFKIEHGIPIPPKGVRKSNTGLTATLRKLQPGDSFKVPYPEGSNPDGVRAMIYMAAKANGLTIVTRQLANGKGVRVWLQ